MGSPLAAFLHRLDPYLLGPWGGFGVRWYGLSYVAGFAAAYLLVRALARRGRSALDPARAGEWTVTLAVGAVLGGRLGYCLLYQPELVVEVSGRFPYWGVLAIHKGGMASHGGMAGILLACLWFARKHRVCALHLLDLAVLAAPAGIFLGRLANFQNGELYGRPCSPDLLWSVRFPHEIRDWRNPADPGNARLRTPEFQKVLELARAPGGAAAPGDDLERIIEASRTDDRLAEALGPLLTPRHPSQLYEALLEGPLLLLVLLWIWRVPRAPGLLAGWFLVSYAAVRVFAEEFRMPDAHLGLRWLGLSRGQWLSIIMGGAGAVFLAFRARTAPAVPESEGPPDPSKTNRPAPRPEAGPSADPKPPG